MGAARFDYVSTNFNLELSIGSDNELKIGIRETDLTSPLLDLSSDFTATFKVIQFFCEPTEVLIFTLTDTTGIDLLDGPAQPAEDPWNVQINISDNVMSINSVPDGILWYQFQLVQTVGPNPVRYQEGFIEFSKEG